MHVVNRLLRENWKPIPKFLNVTHHILFLLDNKNNKKKSIWCNVIFLSSFTALNITKMQIKFLQVHFVG